MTGRETHPTKEHSSGKLNLRFLEAEYIVSLVL